MELNFPSPGSSYDAVLLGLSPVMGSDEPRRTPCPTLTLTLTLKALSVGFP